MVPGTFTNFFIASAGAGAALLGLLFVSLSIAPEEKITADASVEKRTGAHGALSSLMNAFFVSLIALLPTNVSIAFIIFSGISFAITLQNGIELLRPHEGASHIIRRLIIILANLLIYVLECYYAVLLLLNPHDPEPVYVLANILLFVYGFGIIRAWELLGGTRRIPINLLTPKRSAKTSSSAEEDEKAPISTE